MFSRTKQLKNITYGDPESIKVFKKGGDIFKWVRNNLEDKVEIQIPVLTVFLFAKKLCLFTTLEEW